jgi:hypothetical protein
MTFSIRANSRMTFFRKTFNRIPQNININQYFYYQNDFNQNTTKQNDYPRIAIIRMPPSKVITHRETFITELLLRKISFERIL